MSWGCERTWRGWGCSVRTVWFYLLPLSYPIIQIFESYLSLMLRHLISTLTFSLPFLWPIAGKIWFFCSIFKVAPAVKEVGLMPGRYPLSWSVPVLRNWELPHYSLSSISFVTSLFTKIFCDSFFEFTFVTRARKLEAYLEFLLNALAVSVSIIFWPSNTCCCSKGRFWLISWVPSGSVPLSLPFKANILSWLPPEIVGIEKAVVLVVTTYLLSYLPLPFSPIPSFLASSPNFIGTFPSLIKPSISSNP